MEEDEYKATYDELASNRCVFEKALTNNHCKCRYAQHFCLADREGYACKSEKIAAKCSHLQENLRENSRFFLKAHTVGKQLPHNIDIRVQVGGLRGLRSVVSDEVGNHPVLDIRALIEQAEQRFGSLEMLPYSEIVQSIASYQGRARGKQGRKND